LNARRWHVVVLKELANSVRTVDLKPVLGARELLKKSHVVKGSTDEEELLIVLLTRLMAQLIRPEENAM
jgi:hypothetical protein